MRFESEMDGITFASFLSRYLFQFLFSFFKVFFLLFYGKRYFVTLVLVNTVRLCNIWQMCYDFNVTLVDLWVTILMVRIKPTDWLDSLVGVHLHVVQMNFLQYIQWFSIYHIFPWMDWWQSGWQISLLWMQNDVWTGINKYSTWNLDLTLEYTSKISSLIGCCVGVGN